MRVREGRVENENEGEWRMRDRGSGDGWWRQQQ